MRLSFTTFACPTWPLREILTQARHFNYHGVEFRTDAGHNHGVEAWTNVDERKRYRELFDRIGIHCACLATSIQFTSNNPMDAARERIKLAADLGAPGVRMFVGPVSEPYNTLDDALPELIPLLRDAAEYADMLGIDVWLETHDSIARGSEAARVIRQVNHRRLGICYNNLHPIRRGEPLEATLAHLSGMIRHVHFHDGHNHPDHVFVTPIGQGQMPMRDTLQLLLNQGYAAHLCGEWFYDQYGANVNDALEQYAEEVRALAKELGLHIPME